MGIEKMSMMSAEGPIGQLDEALMACCESGQFQMTSGSIARSANAQNPYSGIYTRIRDMAVNLKIEPEYCDFKYLPYETAEDFENYFDGISKRYDEINEKYLEVTRSLDEHKSTESYLKHLVGMDVSFKELFAMKYVKLRIGRLPVENERKLKYYEEKCFSFFPFERNDGYVYGLYLVPTTLTEFADEIMRSLFFERTRLPDYLQEDPENADKKLSEQIAEEEKEKLRLEKETAYLTDELKGDFRAVMCKLKFKSDCFELRRKAIITEDRFSFTGYCPTREFKKIEKAVEELDGVSCVEIPVEKKDAPADVPIKLRNNIITRPFEMFVKMYGLPTYGAFDPTPYVAWTYMILFGIMFGDVGQGLLITILGIILTKKTKNGLAPIMTRLGLFSMCGGCIYGSVFGIETIIKPIYHREEIWKSACRLFGNLGVSEHPESIFQAATAVLIVSLAIGVVLILISMIFNMVLKFRAHKLGEALFSVNGAAGIIFYVSLVAAAAGQLMYGVKMFTAPYVICLIVLPLVAIFFKEPLGDLVTGKKSAEKKTVGNFIIENFIEIFEAVISFLSNTMSYLRVGGFVLSHAGFMLVVSQLAGTADASAPITAKTIIAYVIGNLVVMGIEGLLVGIQALRLEFYEIFNRFYDGSGKSFAPTEIKLDV